MQIRPLLQVEINFFDKLTKTILFYTSLILLFQFLTPIFLNVGLKVSQHILLASDDTHFSVKYILYNAILPSPFNGILVPLKALLFADYSQIFQRNKT